MKNDCNLLMPVLCLLVIESVDMRAIYMRSVRSPGGPLSGGRYKLKYDYDRDIDVFSQRPPQQSEYLEDSFCVGDGYQESGQCEMLGWSLILYMP